MATRFTGWPRGTQITLELEESGWIVAVYLPFSFAQEAGLPNPMLRGIGRTMHEALASVEQTARVLIESRQTAAVTS